MELCKFQHILAFLSVVLVIGSHVDAGLPSEDYWKSVLPTTPMPKAVKDLFQPAPSTVTSGFERSISGDSGFEASILSYGDAFEASVLPYGYRFETSKLRHGAAESQRREDPNLVLYFLENDLHPGKRMTLQFSSSKNLAKWLPRQVSDSIPFSTTKLPEILHKFSVDPSSDEARVMKKTIQVCEKKGINGEERSCATSLESMVDFSTSKLGKDVEALSTNVENGETKEYKVVGIRRMPSGKGVVACHKLHYPYAVFYCHKIGKTVVYKALLVAADGSKGEALAACHRDTAAWNPKHLAFQVLKDKGVKPGGRPICHFLLEGHIVWVNSN